MRSLAIPESVKSDEFARLTSEIEGEKILQRERGTSKKPRRTRRTVVMKGFR